MSEPLTVGNAVALSDKPGKGVFGHLYEPTKKRMAKEKEIAALKEAVVSASLAYREAEKAYSEIRCAARYDKEEVTRLRWREATDALAEAMKK